MGEMSIAAVYSQVGHVPAAWSVIAALNRRKAAAVWLVSSETTRRLEDWEVAALVRARVHNSPEVTPKDSRLVLRAAEETEKAYWDEYWGWVDLHRKS